MQYKHLMCQKKDLNGQVHTSWTSENVRAAAAWNPQLLRCLNSAHGENKALTVMTLSTEVRGYTPEPGQGFRLQVAAGTAPTVPPWLQEAEPRLRAASALAVTGISMSRSSGQRGGQLLSLTMTLWSFSPFHTHSAKVSCSRERRLCKGKPSPHTRAQRATMLLVFNVLEEVGGRKTPKITKNAVNGFQHFGR